MSKMKIEEVIEIVSREERISCDCLNNICVRRKSALNLAIQALQEKQERDKGCEYCKMPFGKGINVNEHIAQSLIQPDSAVIHQTKNDTPGIVLFCKSQPHGYFDIYFCPMCGRKLSEEK